MSDRRYPPRSRVAFLHPEDGVQATGVVIRSGRDAAGPYTEVCHHGRSLRIHRSQLSPPPPEGTHVAGGPVDADTITPTQLVEMMQTCGFAPGHRDVACQACDAPVGEHCRATGTGPRAGAHRSRPHADRLRAHAHAVHAWRGRCALEWNRLHGLASKEEDMPKKKDTQEDTHKSGQAKAGPGAGERRDHRDTYVERVHAALQLSSADELSHADYTDALEEIASDVDGMLESAREESGEE